MSENNGRPSVISFGYRYEDPPLDNYFVNGDWFDRSLYAIRLINFVNNTRFGISKISYQVKFKLGSLDLPHAEMYLKKAMREIFDIVKFNTFTKDVATNYLRIVITAPSLRNNVNLPFVSFDDVNIDHVLHEIEKVNQSNDGLIFDDLLNFYFMTKS